MLVNHFSQNLFDILIGGPYNSVHLRTISCYVSVINLKLLTYISDQVTVEICTIVGNDGFMHSKSSYKIVTNKISDNILGYRLVRSCFHPLGKIVNGGQNKFVSIKNGWLYRSGESMTQATNGQGELIELSS